MWWVLEKKQMSNRYIDVIKDTYGEATISRLSTLREATKPFLIIVSLHLGSALSSHLFALVTELDISRMKSMVHAIF